MSSEYESVSILPRYLRDIEEMLREEQAPRIQEKEAGNDGHVIYGVPDIVGMVDYRFGMRTPLVIRGQEDAGELNQKLLHLSKLRVGKLIQVKTMVTLFNILQS